MKSKNSIIILGNGFDIAHGIKTSYIDFSNYYLEKIIIPELIKCRRERVFTHTKFKDVFLKKLVSQSTVHDLETPLDYILYHIMKNEISLLKEYLLSNSNYIKEILTNNFLGKLYSNEYINWFNIENTYFDELVSIKKNSGEKVYFSAVQKLNSLNKDFEEIKNEFNNYLHTLTLVKTFPIESFLKSILSTKKINQSYIINFNYTDTIEEYLKPYSAYHTVKVNYIHGSLKDNNIIFGYGNDQDQDYQDIKDTGIDNFLKFFKTFDYLSNNRYNNIYREAIENFNDYEVHVIGHSLSLSDKTLLKEILDNEKCKRIHLYKREDLKKDPLLVKEEINKLFYSLSRIISNERRLRHIVKSFESSTFFPFPVSL